MKDFVNIRNSVELQNDLQHVRKILGIDPRIHGADPKTIKKALEFVIEKHSLVWESFQTQFGVLSRDYIKRELLKK